MVTREKITSIVDSILTTREYKPYLVYKEFVDYFGEELVDLQYGDISISQVIDSLVTECGDVEISDSLLESKVKVALEGSGFLAGAKIILIRWPQVTIKNERDNEILIKELYAKVKVLPSGKLENVFGLNRADYPISHVLHDYMHSHVRNIPLSHPTDFQLSCLGSGPIRGTMAELNKDYDIDKWKLFCLELDRYVHVESLTGGPYHRMSEILNQNRRDFIPLAFNGYTSRFEFNVYRLTSSELNSVKDFFYKITKEFVSFLIDSKILQFKFVNGAYAIAQSDEDMLIAISDAFIDWYNIYQPAKGGFTYKNLVTYDILLKAVMHNGALLRVLDYRESNNQNVERYRSIYQGKRICYFKGNPVTLNIHSDTEEEEQVSENNQITVLNPNFVSYIVNKIVQFVNTKNV